MSDNKEIKDSLTYELKKKVKLNGKDAENVSIVSSKGHNFDNKNIATISSENLYIFDMDKDYLMLRIFDKNKSVGRSIQDIIIKKVMVEDICKLLLQFNCEMFNK